MSIGVLYFVRNFGVCRQNLTRTHWSLTRKRMNMPKCHLPRYLLDGGFKKGHKKSGRNESGHITTRHKVGPGRKNYRLIDFMRVGVTETDINSNPEPTKSQWKLKKEYKKVQPKISSEKTPDSNIEHKIYRDKVVAFSYDPCRSAMLAKVIGDSSDDYRLILAATGMKEGDTILKSRGPPPKEHDFRAGDTFPLKYFPIETRVFNVETYPGSGGKIARCGDATMSINRRIEKEGKLFVMLERNKRQFPIDGDCLASYGSALTNGLRELPLGKAGRARRYGMGRGGKTGVLRARKHQRQKGRKNLLTFPKKK